MAIELMEALFAGSLAVGLIATFFIVFLAVYIYVALALMTIGNKTKTPNSWMAWIPILNLILMVKIARLPWPLFLVFFLGFIPLLGPWIVLAFTLYVWWKISERRGFPGWLSLLFLIPFVFLIIIGVLAWAKPSTKPLVEEKPKPVAKKSPAKKTAKKKQAPKKKTAKRAKKARKKK